MKQIVRTSAIIAAFLATGVSFNASATPEVARPLQEQGQLQGQVQDQTQGQGQAQSQSATAAAGAVAGAAAGSVSSSGVVLQNNISPVTHSSTQTQNNVSPSQSQVQGDTVVNVNASGGYIASNIPRAPVATAFSAPLTSGIDTCMGSTSAGVQAVGFGVSVGSTWVDENCKRLKNSRELRSMGYSEAAVALLCQDPAVASAMRTAGTPCAVAANKE
jgi:hypothetical protein